MHYTLLKSSSRGTWIGLCLGLCFLLSAPLGAQVRKKIPDPVIERDTVTGEDGTKSWAPIEDKCATCKGRTTTPCVRCQNTERPQCAECDLKKTARCRTCFGSGKASDPLEVMICPFCSGSTWHDCRLCGTRGTFGVTGAKKQTKCGSCKTKGYLPCLVCKGEGHIATLRFGKKHAGQASLRDMSKVKQSLTEALAALEAFEPVENQGKNKKALLKAIKPIGKPLAVTKKIEAHMKTALKAIDFGAQYTQYPEWLREEFLDVRDRTAHIVKYQLVLLEKCMAFAEHNDQAKKSKQ